MDIISVLLIELTPIRDLILVSIRVNILMLDFLYCLHVINT